jgi:glycosyltransferase involved in cell wall biosynthesis
VRVLVVNNFVRQGSGIDASVAIELRALAARGHQVELLRRDNLAVDTASPLKRAALLASSLYSMSCRVELESLLERRATEGRAVDVVHLHNLVPFITGAVYDACRKHGVPTVQHLRNYRAFCLSSYAYRDGRGCDECWSTAFVACVGHRCYRDSRLASAGLVAARWIDWSRRRRGGYGADRYIANSAFTRSRHVAHGLAAEAIDVLHNPAEDLGALCTSPDGAAGRAAYQPRLTFVGSLIKAKGPWKVLDLAAALPEFQVSFIGAGDDEQALRRASRERGLANVAFHGLLAGKAKAAAWADSFLTLVPSLWDEPFGNVVPESYSLSVPVLATPNGGLAETVDDGVTGLRLDAARIADAADDVRALWADRPRALAMRGAARAEYERRFTEPVFGERLEALLSAAAGQS